ncbi:MAG: hypothetical protein QXL10_00995 [Candidatus Bathyarchaeia archaeon]
MRRNLFNAALAAFAACLHIFSLWQLDLINVLPVWNTPLFLEVLRQQGLSVYADGYFQCFLWKTSVGMAYDVLFAVNFMSFWLLFAALWFWNEAPKQSQERVAHVQPKRACGVVAAVGVGFGYALALAGAFEQALGCGDPVWSSVFGFPFPHHYLIGFAVLGVSLLVLCWEARKL